MCNLGKPCNDKKFIINSFLQILNELVKGTHENNTSFTMQADIITILIITISIDKLLVLYNTTTSKTVTLWILYMKTIEISLQFLRGRCTGDWQQHLDMNHMTLWYFASLSHYDYQKSMYLHLQTMSQIHVTHPGLPKHFMNVLHVIRTTDRFCASHSLDLVM